jgi:NADPH:quinone reductase-like Zn-dependent oxidoreductase
VRAIQITETGGPDVLRLAELPDPEPGCGQVAAAGINYFDTYHRSGAYPVPLPFIPGSDGMGLLLTQLATARGARVIGTVSTPEKEQLAREAGAAEVIRYTEIDHLPLPG